MTAQDLAAARERVRQRQADLDDARKVLAAHEHAEYSDALQLIADEVHAAALASPDDTGALDNIALVLTSLGIEPKPQPATTATARR